MIFWPLVWTLNWQIFMKYYKSMNVLWKSHRWSKKKYRKKHNVQDNSTINIHWFYSINRWFHGLYINFHNLIESLQLKWKFGETQHMCLKLHTSSLSKNRLFVTNDNSATKMLHLRQKPEIILSINCYDSWQFALSAKS